MPLEIRSEGNMVVAWRLFALRPDDTSTFKRDYGDVSVNRETRSALCDRKIFNKGDLLSL
jgi:hypothetical protein